MARNEDLMLGGIVGGAIVAVLFVVIATLGGDLDDTRTNGETYVCVPSSDAP